MPRGAARLSDSQDMFSQSGTEIWQHFRRHLEDECFGRLPTLCIMGPQVRAPLKPLNHHSNILTMSEKVKLGTPLASLATDAKRIKYGRQKISET